MTNDNDDEVIPLEDGLRVRVDLADHFIRTEEPEDGIVDLDAELIGPDKEVIGELSGWLVDVPRAMTRGEPLVDFFDAHSQTVYEFGEALFHLAGEAPRAQVEEALGWELDLDTCRIVLVDTVAILAAHQGRGIGARFLNRVVDIAAGGYTFVACQPFPMQHGGHGRDKSGENAEWMAKHGVPRFVPKLAAGRAKLRAYWAAAGFVRVGKSDFYVRPIPYEPANEGGKSRAATGSKTEEA